MIDSARVLRPSPAVITAEEAGLIAGGEAKPYSGRYVRDLVRAGVFPAPIDDRLHPRSWRWARAQVEQYACGEWEMSGRS